MKADRSITPIKAVKILKEHGTELTLDEAQAVLDLMYKFADITARQLNDTNQKSESDEQSVDE